jgi:hypothetical protein
MRRYEHLEDSFIKVATWGGYGVFVDPDTGAFIAQIGDSDTDYCISSETLEGLRKNVDAAEKRLGASKEKKVKREPIPIWEWGAPRGGSSMLWRSQPSRFVRAYITNIRVDTGKAMVKIGDARSETNPYGSFYRDMSDAERAEFVRLHNASEAAREAFDKYSSERRIVLDKHANKIWGET